MFQVTTTITQSLLSIEVWFRRWYGWKWISNPFEHFKFTEPRCSCRRNKEKQSIAHHLSADICLSFAFDEQEDLNRLRCMLFEMVIPYYTAKYLSLIAGVSVVKDAWYTVAPVADSSTFFIFTSVGVPYILRCGRRCSKDEWQTDACYIPYSSRFTINERTRTSP